MTRRRQCWASDVRSSHSSRMITLLDDIDDAYVLIVFLIVPMPLSSDAFSSRNLSPASRCANVVFPVPGGPYRSRCGNPLAMLCLRKLFMCGGAANLSTLFGLYFSVQSTLMGFLKVQMLFIQRQTPSNAPKAKFLFALWHEPGFPHRQGRPQKDIPRSLQTTPPRRDQNRIAPCRDKRGLPHAGK
eukprot:jgi/Antlo1/259/2192